MAKVFVVGGSTGEYSDRSEWSVCAYTLEDDAKAHVNKATEYAAAWQAFARSDEGREMDYSERRELMNKANPMDDAFECNYTGTSYFYVEVDLRDSFTTPEAIN